MSIVWMCVMTAATTGAAWAGGEPVVFPPDSGVVNVRDFGAKGDGRTDDTQALRRAIAETGGNRTLYLPDGVYLISDTVETRQRDGQKWVVFLTLQGQSTEGTIIKLKDHSPAFADGSKPAPMLRTRDGNMAFRYRFSHFTLDTGKGNPGATGIAFISCNLGSLMHVNVRDGNAGDGSTSGGASGGASGGVGIDCTGSNPGLSLVKHVTVTGFDVGIDFGNIYPGMAFEHVTLRGQNTAGFRAGGTNGAAIRGLVSENAAPAVVVHNQAQVVLTDSDLRGLGDDGDGAAIINRDQGQVMVRNTAVTGYDVAIRDDANRREVKDGPIDEYLSQEAASIFASTGRSLALPVAEVPELPWDAGDDFARWENVKAHGATGDGKTDDTDALEAALAAAKARGKHTVYFPQGTYKVSRTLVVDGPVRRLIGMPSTIEPIHKAKKWPWHGSFEGKTEPIILRVETGSPTVVIDRLALEGTVEHAAANDVVFRLGQGVVYRNTVTGGRAFFEDYGGRFEIKGPQKVFTRLWNPTWGNADYPFYRFDPDDPAYARNDGGTLWVMGVDHESSKNRHVMVRNLNGAKTEILGLLDWQNRPASRTFESIDSDISIAGLRTHTGTFPTETREGWARTEKIGKRLLVVADLPEGGEVPGAVAGLRVEPTGEAWPFNMKLTWDAAGAAATPVIGYEVLRDGKRLGFTPDLSWIDPAMQDDTEHRYEVRALGKAMARSAPTAATARTPADTVPLAVEAVYATSEPARMHVVFSKPVEVASATDAAAYTVAGATVHGAAVERDGRTVTLKLDSLKAGTHPGVTVTGVRDRAVKPNTIASATVAAAVTGPGDGLLASYFADVSMAGPPRVERVVPQLACDWLAWSPVPELPDEEFAVRWAGRVLAARSEIHTFNIESADGVRLWIDGRKVFDTWDEASSFNDTYGPEVNWRPAEPVALTAGRLHDIRLELRKHKGDARLTLRWDSPSMERDVVPASVLHLPEGTDARAVRQAASARFDGLEQGSGLDGIYHRHPYQKQGHWSRLDANIDLSFGTNPPQGFEDKLRNYYYKIEWHGWLRAEQSGWHTIGMDLGQKNAAKVFIDGFAVLHGRTWWGQDRQTREGGKVWLDAGELVPIYVFYRHEDGNALAELWWQPPGGQRQTIPTRVFYPSVVARQHTEVQP